jgi:hypothetical protein
MSGVLVTGIHWIMLSISIYYNTVYKANTALCRHPVHALICAFVSLFISNSEKLLKESVTRVEVNKAFRRIRDLKSIKTKL